MSEIESALQGIWQEEPSLRPRPDLHDYPLTYPPAVQIERPQHARSIDDGEFERDVIGALPAAGYYFHFGFCVYRCRYCFHYELKIGENDALMDRYVSALVREMATVRALTRMVRTGLYFLGGGTPTALPLPLLERFLGALLLHYGPPPTEMSTVEAKPVTASNEKLDALVSAGFRRINLGVQTLDPDLYAFHHHGESVEVALDAVRRARERGFRWINIDIMTGLEKQSPESWQKTLHALELLALRGEIDSFFIYPFHDDPRSRTFQKPERVPPFTETAESDAQARELADRLGWKELGARFYRSPRHVRRELWELARTRMNPAYGEVLYHGFGNSSFSLGDRASYLNHRDVNRYCEAVAERGLGVSHAVTLDDGQRATRDVTFDMLYSPVTRVRSRIAKYGLPAMQRHLDLFDRWKRRGLATDRGVSNKVLGTLSLTPRGKLLHQQMIPEHYLPEDRRTFVNVMQLRKESGKAYRGY